MHPPFQFRALLPQIPHPISSKKKLDSQRKTVFLPRNGKKRGVRGANLFNPRTLVGFFKKGAKSF